jgi:hypothetical protein
VLLEQAHAFAELVGGSFAQRLAVLGLDGLTTRIGGRLARRASGAAEREAGQHDAQCSQRRTH